MDALVAQVTVDDEKIILVKPQTFMNDSGRAVGPLMRWYKVEQPDVYVAYDDMDLAVGRLRIRRTAVTADIMGLRVSLPTAAPILPAFASVLAARSLITMSSITS